MKRKIGVLCMVLGTVLLCLALFLFLYNRWEAARAEEAASEIALLLDEQIEESEDASRQPESGERTDGEMDTVEIDGYAYIGTLSVPRFGLELPIMSEWSYSGLKIAPGRYSGSVWTGNLVICGHNYERHFGMLKNLEAGDRIVFTDVSCAVFEYEVTEVTTLRPTDVDVMLGRDSGEWDLTLFTCTYGGRARVTVRCSLAEE